VSSKRIFHAHVGQARKINIKTHMSIRASLRHTLDWPRGNSLHNDWTRIILTAICKGSRDEETVIKVHSSCHPTPTKLTIPPIQTDARTMPRQKKFCYGGWVSQEFHPPQKNSATKNSV
jgi:hypothetical protein